VNIVGFLQQCGEWERWASARMEERHRSEAEEAFFKLEDLLCRDLDVSEQVYKQLCIVLGLMPAESDQITTVILERIVLENLSTKLPKVTQQLKAAWRNLLGNKATSKEKTTEDSSFELEQSKDHPEFEDLGMECLGRVIWLVHQSQTSWKSWNEGFGPESSVALLQLAGVCLRIRGSICYRPEKCLRVLVSLLLECSWSNSRHLRPADFAPLSMLLMRVIRDLRQANQSLELAIEIRNSLATVEDRQQLLYQICQACYAAVLPQDPSTLAPVLWNEVDKSVDYTLVRHHESDTLYLAFRSSPTDVKDPDFFRTWWRNLSPITETLVREVSCSATWKGVLSAFSDSLTTTLLVNMLSKDNINLVITVRTLSSFLSSLWNLIVLNPSRDILEELL